MEKRIKGVLSPKPSGSITITENGNYDVVDVANALVDVRPSGTIEITENGEHDVSDYATANVDVKFDKTTVKKLLDISKRCNNMFQNRTELLTIDDILNYEDTENVTTMAYMFDGSGIAEDINLNTSKVVNMEYMFNECLGLLRISKLNTSNVTNMGYMFAGCDNLEIVENIDTSKATNLTRTFSSCDKLKSVPKISINNATTKYMFYYCKSLKKMDITLLNSSLESFARYSNISTLIIRSFGEKYTITNDCFQNNPIYEGNGYVYVPKAMVDTLKATTNWSIFQYRALEDYTIDGTTTGELDESKI